MSEEDAARYYAVTPGGDLETLRGDIHHLLNPLIGRLRMLIPGFDPDTVEVDPRRPIEIPDSQPETVLLATSDLVLIVQRMRVVTELCDMALGERPMAEQLAALVPTSEVGR